jgi:murein DD-endopeptidase / murein LD-carboxypeptidase
LKNLQSLSLVVLLLASVNLSAQIVTSKKEAQKKGIYSYTEKQVSQPVANQNAAPATESRSVMSDVAAVVQEPVKPAKELKKGGPRKTEAPETKSRKLLAESEKAEPDFEPETTPYLAQQIVNNAMQFEGVRYRGGGTTTAGMDCSGLVYTTFRIFDITLPRSSRDMAKAGEEIKLSEVRKGDLLFFDNNRSRRGINHVGMVTEVTPEGEVLFLHSSTSSGVIVSSLNEPYYDKTFVQANRVIQE